jgi:SAM-dependent methyltransferase
MGLADARDARHVAARGPDPRVAVGPDPRVAADPHPRVVWHDLECGDYRADLPLWLELADAHPEGPILDIGAGSGRVTLALARAGRRVIALDSDPALLAALRLRAERLDIETVETVETVCADARDFALPRDEQAPLCIVPMQTLQLLGGPTGRAAFLRCARTALAPGGLLACALVVELEPFDCTAGGPGPTPEQCNLSGVLYTSQATRVALEPGTIAIERHRRTGAQATVERDLIELDRVDAAQVEQEASALGFQPEPARHISSTADHSGSSVAMLRA